MSRFALALGDGVVLVLFTLLGVRAHGGIPDPDRLLRTAVPLLLSWAAASWALGTYRRPVRTGWLGAWPVGILAGVFLRQALLGRPLWSTGTATFALVSLGVTGVLLAAWRFAAAAWEARGMGTHQHPGQ
ncbi:MAG: DUF3054 domain-containing protein [Armatimonadota bacterium]|nr:DUF3054 domain-containing protein [Armatimonadota bacterium]MDR7444378.1 DUF3054 domain-containing protein [Armatimonadota bacterium]MDR7570735.1 DUF3054 domain-containing protein [Armatimonadota bacterium]MDR7614865.1 DUF3054 domain-containing protein [Armatimonadota bacterium]